MVILRIAKRVPEMDIVAVIKKNTNLVIGWKVNNVPALAIPFLNPSMSAYPIINPMMAEIIACIKINFLMYPFDAPIAFKVP